MKVVIDVDENDRDAVLTAMTMPNVIGILVEAGRMHTKECRAHNSTRRRNARSSLHLDCICDLMPVYWVVWP